MNETDPIATPLPPAIPLGARLGDTRPLGEDPSERVPITHVAAVVEAVLRHPRRMLFQLYQPGAGKLLAMLLLVALGCSLAYGAVVGTFSGGAQLWLAPAKIVIGLFGSALICLPSLYIFICLSGSQARLREVCGLLAGLLMLMTLLLIGFAPVAWIFSQSTDSIAWMGALHLVFWLIATLFGLRFLRAGLTHTRARSRIGVHIWTAIFLLVALQMTATLRPIIGTSDTFLPKEKQFFLAHWADCLGATTSGTKPAARN